MEVYDDRPISVYDNLKAPTNIHTSTPKAKTIAATTTTTSSPFARATNGATCSPIYTDISFKFNDNKQQPQQQQQPVDQSQLLPNSNRSLHLSHLPTTSQVHTNSSPAPYAYIQHTSPAPTPTPAPAPARQTLPTQQIYMPIAKHTTIATPANGAAVATTVTTTAPAKTPLTAGTAATAIATATETERAAAAAMNASPAQRPLSQHSQTELNEASQSIAAVKAALNDAKSKFFGLNGYAAQEQPATATANANANVISNTRESPEQRLHLLLPDNQQNHFPRVQIITTAPTPPPKPQPKYQNIPENSAIFRNQPPPELPPKPDFIAPAPANVSTSPTMATIPASPSTSTTPISAAQSPQSPQTPTATTAQSKILPHAAYKQLPLNDIDTVQPSQAVYMSTTVPQNIKGSKIAGRHTPTRNSLRHSRMLVVNNKNYQGMQHPNPMNFKYPNLARWLLILQIVNGLLLSFLAIWIFFLAPNTAVQDNPYWSGLALLLAGILGLVLVRYQRIKRHKVRENCFIFLRADSYLLSLLATLLCCVALTCAAIHFARLTASDTKCVSTNILLEHGSCTCTFNAVDVPTTNGTADVANGLFDEEVVPDDFVDRSYKFEYRDLSCTEVNGAWTFILGLSIGLNALGLLVSLIYIVLLVCFRHNSKRFYTSVHTSTF